jgi:hypothetical protein
MKKFREEGGLSGIAVEETVTEPHEMAMKRIS